MAGPRAYSFGLAGPKLVAQGWLGLEEVDGGLAEAEGPSPDLVEADGGVEPGGQACAGLLAVRDGIVTESENTRMCKII